MPPGGDRCTLTGNPGAEIAAERLFRYAARTHRVTSREAVRTAIAIGGIWLIFRAFETAAGMLAGFAETWLQVDRDASEGLLELFLVYVPITFAAVAIAALPGIWAILSRYKWSEKLVPEEDGSVEVGPSLILPVGAMLLGLSIGVFGAIELLASGFTMSIVAISGGLGESITFPIQLTSLTRGIVSCASGILVFRWGSRGALRAA